MTWLWPGVLAAVVLVVGARPRLLSPRWWRLWRRAWRKRLGLPTRGKPPTAAVYRAVMAADRWLCVACGSPDRPEWDHVRPDRWGFRATRRNGACLCWVCNHVKSDYWVDRRGVVHYHPWPGFADVARAAEIYRAEVRASRRLGRMARLYLAR